MDEDTNPFDLTAGETLHVRGENGATFDVDVPSDGTTQREIFEDSLTAGRLVIVSDDEPEPKPRGRKTKDEPEPKPEPTAELTEEA